MRIDGSSALRNQYISTHKRFFTGAFLLFSLGVSLFLTNIKLLFNDHVYRASTEILFLGTEMQNEAGPHYFTAKKMHHKLLERYIERIEKRRFAQFISFVKPKYDARLNLQSALDSLACQDISETSSRDSVEQAAKVLTAVAKVWAQGKNPILLTESGRTSQSELLIKKEVRDLSNSIDALRGSDRGIATAELACMDSRLVSSVVLQQDLPANLGAGDPLIAQLINTLISLRTELDLLASEVSESERSQVEHYVANVDRRAKFFAAINSRGFSAGQAILLSSLER
jgi:hypothetical protein